ncbi:MAG: HEAT repeat domain-containing protein [Cyanobacteriota bacterium]|nr:HEAT repeat domain-containing protein [Cyanobacteriota bacterium]
MTDSARVQELIQAVEQANSDERLLESVQALAACRSEAAIPMLIAVLGYNNPGAAVTAVEGLIALGASAVMPLLEQLDEYNYGARAYSIRALAALADPRALDTLVSAATIDFAPSVRRAAAKGLGNLHWHQLPPEEIAQAQTKVLNTLIQVFQDSDWAIRYAAIVGLQALAKSATSTTEPIQNLFEQRLSSEADPAVRSRILMAQQRLQAENAIA